GPADHLTRAAPGFKLTSLSARRARRPPQRFDWGVYMLRCADGSLYTGATNDLTRRVSRHQEGKASAYTRSRLPVRLVFSEPAANRRAALRREAELKQLTRAEKLTLIGG